VEEGIGGGVLGENPVSAGFSAVRGLTPFGGHVPKEISPVSAVTSTASQSTSYPAPKFILIAYYIYVFLC
jgi:hypothetical protein